LKHWGVEIDQTTAAATGSGNFILEYATASAEWVEIGSMAVSSEEQYRYANNVFLRANSTERLYAGISDDDPWPEIEINGVTGRWMRARIESTVTTAPVFERFRLMPSHTEINKKGQKFASGLAQWKKTVSSGGLRWSGNKLGNANVDIGSASPWDHELEKAVLGASSDWANTQLIIPAGLCTAFPLQIRFLYGYTTATAGGSTVSIKTYVADVQGNFIADAAGAIIPVARTEAQTQTLIANPYSAANQTTAEPVINKLFRIVKDTPADISGNYEGDVVFIQFEMVTTAGNQIVLYGMEIQGVAFTDGGTRD